jgi:protein-tyrosine kinase
MEQIERALRKSRQQRVAVMSNRNGFAAKARHSRGAAHTQTKCVTLAPEVLQKHRIVTMEAHNAVTDIYRALRAKVLQELTLRGKRTIGITSANRDEGKTLTAVNLAIAMAMDVNRTILLVDADLRNPSVAHCFGIEPALGVSDHLVGGATIADCLIHPRIQRLTIFPARSRIGNSAELLSSPQMTMMTQELKDRYADRIVIYDLPPLLSGGDAIGFLPSVDATLLVVRDGVARTGHVRQALELLAGHDLIGTILNATPTKAE